MLKLLRRFLTNESGQDLIEYVVLTGFISLSAVAFTLTSLGNSVGDVFDDIGQALPLSDPADSGPGDDGDDDDGDDDDGDDDDGDDDDGDDDDGDDDDGDDDDGDDDDGDDDDGDDDDGDD